MTIPGNPLRPVPRLNQAVVLRGADAGCPAAAKEASMMAGRPHHDRYRLTGSTICFVEGGAP